MSKLKKDVKVKDLVVLIILLIVAITSLVIYINATAKDRKERNTKSNTPSVTLEKPKDTTEKASYDSSKEEVIKYLSGLGEYDRMKYYCGEYIKLLKHQEYEKAYSLLYDEFKQNYFPTYDEYVQYVKSFYPSLFAVKYDDISRQGDLYILRLKIIDAHSSNENNEVVQRFVFKENDYDDFVLSFQVKKEQSNNNENDNNQTSNENNESNNDNSELQENN